MRRHRASLFIQKLREQYEVKDVVEIAATRPSFNPFLNGGLRNSSTRVLSGNGPVLAKASTSVMEQPPESPPTVLDEAPTEEDIGDGSDEAWASRVLPRTKAGRDIREHLSAEDERIRRSSCRESACQTALCFRRTLCHALAKNATAFGLPHKLPKLVAVINLSGKRHVVYSQTCSLARLMSIISVHASIRLTECLDEMVDFASKRGVSLLFTYALPWQSLDESYFELRTLERQSDGTVVDGEYAYATGWQDVRTAASTIQTDSTDSKVIEAQIASLGRHCAAVNLDMLSTDKGTVEDDSDRIRKMHDVTTLLQTERKKLLSDLTTLRAEKQHQVTTITSQYEKRIGELTKAADKAANSSEKIIDEFKTENAGLKKQNAALEKAVKHLKQQVAESALVHDAEQETLGRNFADATTALKEFQKVVGKQRAQAEKDREKSESALYQTIDKLESRVQHETIERRRAEEKVAECDKTWAEQRRELVEAREALKKSEAAKLDVDKRNVDLLAKNGELYKINKASKSAETKRMAEVHKNAEVSIAEATAQVVTSRELLASAKADMRASNAKTEDLKARVEAAEADAKALRAEMGVDTQLAAVAQAEASEDKKRLEDMKRLRSTEQAHLAKVEAEHKKELASLQCKHEEELAKAFATSVDGLEPPSRVVTSTVGSNTEIFISDNESKLELEIAKRHDETERLKKEVVELKKEVVTTREQHLAVVMKQQQHQQQHQPPLPQLMPSRSQTPQQMMQQQQQMQQMQQQQRQMQSRQTTQVPNQVSPQQQVKCSERVETADELRTTIEGALAKLVGIAKMPALDSEAERLRVENAVLKDLMRPASQQPYPQQQQAASFGYFTSVTQ